MEEKKKKSFGGPLVKTLGYSEDMEVRRKLMRTQKILGWSMKEIGEYFNVNTQVVKHELEKARRERLIATVDKAIIEALLPKAIGVVAKHLDEGNYDAAKDILQGLGFYNKGAIPIRTDDRDITLELVRAKIHARKATNEEVQATGGNETTVTVVEQEDPKALGDGIREGEIIDEQAR